MDEKPVAGTPAEKEALAREEQKEQETKLPAPFVDTTDVSEEQIMKIKTKPLAELFGIKDVSSDVQQELNLVYKWVLSERGSDDRTAFVDAVRDLTNRLGIPTVSGSNFHQLVNWIRADLAEKEARKEKELYEQASR